MVETLSSSNLPLQPRPHKGLKIYGARLLDAANVLKIAHLKGLSMCLGKQGLFGSRQYLCKEFYEQENTKSEDAVSFGLRKRSILIFT